MSTLTYETDGIQFVWAGGEYIDVYLPGSEDPDECINVWDHNSGKAVIPFTNEALRKEAEDFLKS